MFAKLKKTKKSDVKITFKELWEHAQDVFGRDNWLYVRAPYSMSRDEFLSQYARFFIILPHFPTRQELEAGIFQSTTGALMMKFWTAPTMTPAQIEGKNWTK